MTRALRPLLLLLAMLLAGPALAQEIRLAPGQPLAMPELRELLADAVPSAENGRRHEVRLGAPQLPMRNGSAKPVTIRIGQLQLDDSGRRFTGLLEVLVEHEITGTVPLAGELRSMVQIPVPAQHIQAGQILGAADLVPGWIAEDQLADGVLLASAEANGLEAGKRLAPGRPIMAADLRPSRLVRKGEVVQLVYRNGRMLISTQAKALEDAGQGDSLRVSNLDSSRIVKGVVTGRRLVTVGSVEIP